MMSVRAAYHRQYLCVFLRRDDLRGGGGGCAAVLLIRIKTGCKDLKGPRDPGFDGCYKRSMPIEMPHHCPV